MMSETEDFDELPPITVNSSANDASTFLMPSAQTIASQRAREEACERELRELRARDERLAAHEVARDVMLLAHSDSSGSEGEAALAAAVTALNVAPPRPNPQPSAADVLADVRPHVPPPYEPLCEPGVDFDQVVRHISSLVSLEERWSDEEVCGAGALLCAALVSDTRHKRVAARALHALLDHRATEQQVWGLEHVLLQSWGCARVRMRVSDAARSGAGGGADALADKLLWAALATLLQLPTHELWPPSVEALADAARARWRRVELAARYRTVAAAGRALAALGPAAHPAPRARLLAVLAPPHEHERHRPDRLKVLVGASKLRLLFRSEQ